MSVRQLAIIVAGGKGLRMGSDLPKQFMLLGGRPVLMWTLERFESCDERVLVLPLEHQAYWRQLCQHYAFSLEHTVATGGATRYHSVLSGLHHLETLGAGRDDLVAVHDGVRPLASREVIAACYQTAARHGSALPYRPMTDSLRQKLPKPQGGSRSVDRSQFVAVQTPQTFVFGPLLEAYTRGYQETFTDDASVWEAAGLGSPHLVLGNEENIKLTTPIDLHLAELYLSTTAE